MTGFAVYGRMTAKPGRRDALIDALRESIIALGEPAGLRDYTFNAALDDPDTLWITQIWTTKSAHDTATKTEANKARTRALADLLAEPIEGRYGEIVERGGSPSD
jgi:quinol monooxygenase YgiN